MKFSRPLNSSEIAAKGLSRLLNDPAHKYRAESGIELIHKEPSIEELERIYANWQLMKIKEKLRSDKKSKELFGMGNEEHYRALRPLYSKLR